MKNSNTKKRYSSKLQNIQQDYQQKKDNTNLIDLINMITQARQNKTKSQTNLAARMINMNKQEPKSYSKSVSSTFTGLVQDGHKHVKGKQVINNSTKPFLEINEMQDGQVEHFMIPKNTIPYEKPMHMPMQIQSRMPMQIQSIMPMQIRSTMPKSSIVMYTTSTPIIHKASKKSKTPKSKNPKKSKSKKTKKPKSKTSNTAKSKKPNTQKSKKSNKSNK